jgi:serine/threonine protein kinase
MTGRRAAQGSPSEPNPHGEAAESVPGYRDLARIGHGGFSVVYRAVQESFERAVALKVLTVAGSDEDARRRFLREVRLASRLSGHPHVVTVLDTGTTDSGRPYLAMDLYDGGSLKQHLTRSGPLSAAETAAVGAKIADALAAAHSLGVLHRDVKPNNILVSRFGEPALADFGVSCLVDSSSSASVLDVFSPQHAAPELITRGVPSKSGDVYSLGSTLYELVTGRAPFDGENRDVRSVLWRAVSEPTPRPDCPDLPGLAEVIVRAMAKDPQERFPDAAAFAAALRALIPEGRSATLELRTGTQPFPEDAIAADWLEPGTGADATGSQGAGFHLEPDATSTGNARGTHSAGGHDETMLRPDRAEPSRSPAPARSGRRAEGSAPGSDDDRSRTRGGKPALAVAGAALVGAIAWAVIAWPGPSAAARDDASARRPTAPASSRAPLASASARPTASASAKPRHHATAAASATGEAAAPTGAAPSSSTSAPLLSLPGAYHQFRNAQNGECLANPEGSAVALSPCSAGQSAGWEYSEALTGILTGPVSGEFELVDQRSGSCLAATSSGQISTQTCSGEPAQLWSKTSAGSDVELRNADFAQCLRAAGGGVADGPCGASDAADLWGENTTG